MKISGFSMVKNAVKLYYPIKESIMSILPIVDEFVIALGDCDDTTREVIESIGDPKIKIIDTVWDVKTYPSGSILARQTDIAKEHCSGDWLFYIQADEVIHEKDLQEIRSRCEELLDDREVEGLLFKYIHFWADYNHVFTQNHKWYRNEVRIVRNREDIHSWKDAQSFRKIPNFTKEMYLEKEGTEKLTVARVDAHVYHYGWARPPKLMGKKQLHFSSCYKQDNTSKEQLEVISELDFGAVGTVPAYKGSHPGVMRQRVNEFNWADQLNYTKKRTKGTKVQKHEKLKCRILSAIEGILFKEFGLFTFRNFIYLKDK